MKDRDIERLMTVALKKAGIHNIDIENESEGDEESEYHVYRIEFMVDDRKLDRNDIDHDKMEEIIKRAFKSEDIYLDRKDAYPDGCALYMMKIDLKK
jgi:hypothetical protein